MMNVMGPLRPLRELHVHLAVVHRGVGLAHELLEGVLPGALHRLAGLLGGLEDLGRVPDAELADEDHGEGDEEGRQDTCRAGASTEGCGEESKKGRKEGRKVFE